ncbi:CAP domain-containing protein [Streptomyces sp. NPDC059982]|uniref:CAP domain-containing protein n=1 Tax=unclassified Streptomyces TaxID=2593676 RepID=UPI0036847289
MGRHRLHTTPRPGGRRRTVVRGGLLGVSVAVALGTAAVTTGFVPVGGSFPYVGTDSGGDVRAVAKPSPSPDGSDAEQQGGLANLSGRASSVPDPGAGTGSPSVTPSASPSPSTAPPASASASPKAPAAAQPEVKKPEAKKPEPTAPEKSPAPATTKPAATKPAATTPEPAAPKPPAPAPPTPSAAKPGTGNSAEEAAVLTLVNQARAQAGCVPVRANPPLAALAGAFSKDMAVRGFFGHTDPDGNTPWKRADNAGIGGLGGENIARGQGDAASVMDAWMKSPDHKANILNCEFRTLGVGVYFADGGPWWTQDFGF